MLIWSIPFMLRGVTYRAELDPAQTKPLAIYRGTKKVDSIANRAWKPWKLEVGDVDGDGVPDFAIGVLKSTRFIKQPHTSVFIYTFDGKAIHKKWLGSTVGRPLLDFLVEKEREKTFLWTLEDAGEGRQAVRKLSWSGFGFHSVGPEKFFETAEGLVRSNGKIAVKRKGVILPLDHSGLQ